jgi:hypothetical protein
VSTRITASQPSYGLPLQTRVHTLEHSQEKLWHTTFLWQGTDCCTPYTLPLCAVIYTPTPTKFCKHETAYTNSQDGMHRSSWSMSRPCTLRILRPLPSQSRARSCVNCGKICSYAQQSKMDLKTQARMQLTSRARVCPCNAGRAHPNRNRACTHATSSSQSSSTNTQRPWISAAAYCHGGGG